MTVREAALTPVSRTSQNTSRYFTPFTQQKYQTFEAARAEFDCRRIAVLGLPCSLLFSCSEATAFSYVISLLTLMPSHQKNCASFERPLCRLCQLFLLPPPHFHFCVLLCFRQPFSVEIWPFAVIQVQRFYVMFFHCRVCIVQNARCVLCLFNVKC